MLFITLQNNMNFPWTQSLQAALLWSVFSDAGMVVLAPHWHDSSPEPHLCSFSVWHVQNRYPHFSTTAISLLWTSSATFSLSDLGTVTYYLWVSVSYVVRSLPPGSLPRPPMSGSEAFLCMPTIFHTSPSIIFNHTVQWLPDDLFFFPTLDYQSRKHMCQYWPLLLHHSLKNVIVECIPCSRYQGYLFARDRAENTTHDTYSSEGRANQ